MDLDKIELPENHPFAVRKKLAPGGAGLGARSFPAAALSCPASTAVAIPRLNAEARELQHKRSAAISMHSRISFCAQPQPVRHHLLLPPAAHAVQRRRSCSAAGSARGADCPRRTCASCGSSRRWLTRCAVLLLLAQTPLECCNTGCSLGCRDGSMSCMRRPAQPEACAPGGFLQMDAEEEARQAAMRKQRG